MEAERLKESGNKAFQQEDFVEALSLYSQGIDELDRALSAGDITSTSSQEDESTSVDVRRLRCALLTNRANTRFLQGDMEGSIKDADAALQVDPCWAKAHFRKGQAFLRLRQFDHAIETFEAALANGADQKTFTPLLKKAKQSVQSTKANKKGSSRMPQLYPDRPNGFNTKEESENNRAKANLDKLQELLRSGVREKDGLLDGLFARMQNPEHFRQIVYRNAQLPTEVTARMPKSFQELIANQDYFNALVKLFPSIQAKADSVLSNVKAKAAKEGQFMDEATERMLKPQVLNEAFAHKIVDMIHEVNRQQNALLSQVEPLEASASAEEAFLEQIQAQAIQGLQENTKQFGVLDSILGRGEAEESSEWVSLIRADVADLFSSGYFEPRDVADLSKSELAQAGTARTSEGYQGPWSCWVNQEQLEENYQALCEVVQKLQKLPFELNRKAPHLHLRRPLASRVLIYIIGDPEDLVAEAEEGENSDDDVEVIYTKATEKRRHKVLHGNNGSCEGFHSRKDGGFDTRDNGIKISALYMANQRCWAGEHGGCIRMRHGYEPLGSNTEWSIVEPAQDRAILYRSRTVEITMDEISAGSPPQVFVQVFFNGPADEERFY